MLSYIASNSTKDLIINVCKELQITILSQVDEVDFLQYIKEAKVNFKWISSDDIDEKNVALKLRDIDGVVVLPGFGKRGFEGKVITVDYTRKNKIPTLGICFGMQAMTINQARLKGIKDATSSEFGEKGSYILDIIEGKDKENIGGTLRLGEDVVLIKEGTIAHKIYGSTKVYERSRHRYEVNPKYINKLEDKEFSFSAFNSTKKLMEICELKNHPFYVGVQYHPEFTARPLKPSKLFSAFVNAIVSTKD